MKFVFIVLISVIFLVIILYLLLAIQRQSKEIKSITTKKTSNFYTNTSVFKQEKNNMRENIKIVSDSIDELQMNESPYKEFHQSISKFCKQLVHFSNSLDDTLKKKIM